MDIDVDAEIATLVRDEALAVQNLHRVQGALALLRGLKDKAEAAAKAVTPKRKARTSPEGKE